MLAPFRRIEGGLLPPHPVEVFVEPELRVDARTEIPDRVCAYCGHGIYAGPRAVTARCHGCQRQVNVRNVDLHGEVIDGQTVTAGTIRVHADAKVSGDLIGGRVIVEGRVMGRIAASHCCTVRATGKVAGVVICRKLRVEEGAEIDAEIEQII